jgi:hypothetical protein
MSSARRRESSDDDDSSGADAGPGMESGIGDEDCTPSQYRKARLENDSASGVDESDRDSENGVESVISSEGPPSLKSSSLPMVMTKQLIENNLSKTKTKKRLEGKNKSSRSKIAETIEGILRIRHIETLGCGSN